MARKKKGEEAKLESAGMMRWLLTYADMITLLLVFFIILYASSESNAGKMSKVLSAIGSGFGLFKTTKVNTGTQSPIEGGGAALDRTKEDFESKGGDNVEEEITTTVESVENILGTLENISVKSDERGLVVSVSSVFFEDGSAKLRPIYKNAFSRIAILLSQIPNQVRFEGHTDGQGSEGENWELSVTRALTVMKTFINEYNLDSARFSVAGYGPNRPVDSNDTEKGREHNRRVDIVILKGTKK